MRLLAVIAAGVVAAVAWFVFEVWRVSRGDVTPTPTPDVSDEEIDRLADNGIVGMPTWGSSRYVVGERGPEQLWFPYGGGVQ